MEEAERVYSQEEDKKIATLMMNYSAELGFNDSANLSCRERQRKFADFFKKVHRIFNRGKSIQSIRTYSSFCNRFNMIVNELRVLRTPSGITKANSNGSSLLTILEEILLKNPNLGDPRDDDIDMTDIASKTPVLSSTPNMSHSSTPVVNKSLRSSQFEMDSRHTSKPLIPAFYSSKRLATSQRMTSKRIEKEVELGGDSFDSLDSSLSDDNLGDYNPAKTENNQASVSLKSFASMDPVSSSFSHTGLQDKSAKKGKPTETLQVPEPSPAFSTPFSPSRSGAVGLINPVGPGNPGNPVAPTSISTLQAAPSLGVNAMPTVPLSNIAIPDPSSYSVLPSSSPLGNFTSPGYLVVPPTPNQNQMLIPMPFSSPFPNPELYQVTDKVQEMSVQAKKRDRRSSIELPTEASNQENPQEGKKGQEEKTIVIPEGYRNSGIIMHNCSVEIKEIHNYVSETQPSILDEVNDIQKEMEGIPFSPIQIQEIEKRLLQIVAAVNHK